MICVDLKTAAPKLQNNSYTCRDFRKMKKIQSIFNVPDVDEMQNFWTTSINKCLDFTAPWTLRKVKNKKYR